MCVMGLSSVAGVGKAPRLARLGGGGRVLRARRMGAEAKAAGAPKVVCYTAQSVDGVLARQGGGLGSVDWLDPGSFRDGGEAVSAMGSMYEEFLESVGTLVMGRATYEACLSFGEWPYPGKLTYVFSRDEARRGRLEPERQVAWVVGKTPAEWLAGLPKNDQGKGAVWVVGGGELIRYFLAAGLVDEFQLFTISVMLGGGVPFFPADSPPGWGPRALPGGKDLQLRARDARLYSPAILGVTYDVVKN